MREGGEGREERGGRIDRGREEGGEDGDEGRGERGGRARRGKRKVQREERREGKGQRDECGRGQILMI